MKFIIKTFLIFTLFAGFVFAQNPPATQKLVWIKLKSLELKETGDIGHQGEVKPSLYFNGSFKRPVSTKVKMQLKDKKLENIPDTQWHYVPLSAIENGQIKLSLSASEEDFFTNDELFSKTIKISSIENGTVTLEDSKKQKYIFEVKVLDAPEDIEKANAIKIKEDEVKWIEVEIAGVLPYTRECSTNDIAIKEGMKIFDKLNELKQRILEHKDYASYGPLKEKFNERVVLLSALQIEATSGANQVFPMVPAAERLLIK